MRRHRFYQFGRANLATPSRGVNFSAPMKTFFWLFALYFCASMASAECQWVWVDDDNDKSTPAVQKQECDSSVDKETKELPSKNPIQTPQIQSAESHTKTPSGITSCRRETVYDNGGWVTRTLCN